MAEQYIKKIQVGGTQYTIYDQNAIHEQYTHPTYTAHTEGLYKISNDNKGHVIGASAVQSDDIWNLIGIKAGTNISVSEPGNDGKVTINNNYTYTHPTKTGMPVDQNLYKFSVDSQGHISSVQAATKTDISKLVDISGDAVSVNSSTGKITISDTNQKVKAGNVTFGNNDVIGFQTQEGAQTTIRGDATNKTIIIDTSTLESQVAKNTQDINVLNGTDLGDIASTIEQIKSELADPKNGSLVTFLDTVQTILTSTPVKAITEVTLINSAASYGTQPSLSVNDDILYFNPGTITGGTASITSKTSDVIASKDLNNIENN